MLDEVRSGSAVKAKYTWLADGSKLRVRDAGSAGFDYLGSLTYTSNSSGLTLETAQFAGGVIRSGNSQEINYFLTDHLGSVRSIVNSAGTTVEQNDYYAFGAKHVRSTYAKNDNRFDYNGKEEQTTGNLKYLDYGARMYDNTIGRWFNVDPLAEKYHPLSPYNYALNNPVFFIDPDGMIATPYDLNRNETNYVDEDGKLILQTNDGSDDIVVVPEAWIPIMKYYAANYDDWAWRLDDPEWNMALLTGDFGFRLSDRQFSELELFALDLQTSNWSRNATATYFLNPTFENSLRAGFSEIASQWMDPERLVIGASIGVIGLSSLSRVGTKVKAPRPSLKFRAPTNPPQLPKPAPNGLTLRVMRPTSQYPHGYWRWEKLMPHGGSQGINPSTMKPGPQWDTHVPLPPGHWK